MGFFTARPFLRPSDTTAISLSYSSPELQDSILRLKYRYRRWLPSRDLYSKKPGEFVFTMGEALSRPAFDRSKHVLSEEEKPGAFTNDRVHYNLVDFLQKRRGGGGAIGKAASSFGSSSKSAGSCKLDG